MDSAIVDLTNKVTASAALKAAGITVSGTPGGALTFTSAHGEKLNVTSTGDTANVLGLGTFLGGAGNAADLHHVDGRGGLQRYSKTGTTVLEFSLNGAASKRRHGRLGESGPGEMLRQPTATASRGFRIRHGKTLTFRWIRGPAVTVTSLRATRRRRRPPREFTATAFNGVNASVDSAGHLKITSHTMGAHTLTIGGTTTYRVDTGTTITGTARTETNLRDALNAAFSASSTLQTAGLQATVDGGHHFTIASNNGTYFRMNTSTTGRFRHRFRACGSELRRFDGEQFQGERAGCQRHDEHPGDRFSALSYGSDEQSITVSANDDNGAIQTLTFTLQNDGAAAGRAAASTKPSATLTRNCSRATMPHCRRSWR